VIRFDPVFLPPDKGLENKVSATFLGKFNWCPRSAYLYTLFKGQTRTPNMERGKGLHAITERATLACLEQGEPSIPAELVKAIADEVLADPEFAIPVEEHDAIREMSYRWASAARFDPDAVVAVERLFVFELAGWEVRCKIDFAQLLDGGEAVLVTDYKSSRSALPFEDVSRKRKDDTRAAKNLQLILYAMAVAYGFPVWVEPCAECRGHGVVQPVPEAHHDPHTCGDCEGRGYFEIKSVKQVAPRAQTFHLEFSYPAIPDLDDKPVTRPVTLHRVELDAYRASIEGLLARVRHSEQEGDWPAVVSDEACGSCPARQCCPLPGELREFNQIETLEQASDVAMVFDQQQRLQKDLRKALKAFAKEHGASIPFGLRVMEFVPRSSMRDGKEVNGSEFRARDLTADEIGGSK
jgi:hypothetical protein